jgi:hypothetical protein
VEDSLITFSCTGVPSDRSHDRESIVADSKSIGYFQPMQRKGNLVSILATGLVILALCLVWKRQRTPKSPQLNDLPGRPAFANNSPDDRVSSNAPSDVPSAARSRTERPPAQQMDRDRIERRKEQVHRILEDLKRSGMGEKHPQVRAFTAELKELEKTEKQSADSDSEDVDREKEPPGYIGVVLDGPPIRVRGVEPGSPAFASGIQPGDELLTVDEETISHASLEKVIEVMQGSANSSVRLTIMRPGESEPRRYTIRRAPLEKAL